MKITKESVIIVALVFSLAVSMGLNMWQLSNVREVEKIVDVEIPFEVPVEMLQTGYLERFYLKGSEHFNVQFNDGNTDGTPYNFVHGTFIDSKVTFTGEWDVLVTFRLCEIKNVSFNLINIEIRLENCTVENSDYTGTFDSAIHLSGSSFTGSTVFDVNVVNGTGNTGLENVIFEGRMVQSD